MAQGNSSEPAIAALFYQTELAAGPLGMQQHAALAYSFALLAGLGDGGGGGGNVSVLFRWTTPPQLAARPVRTDRILGELVQWHI